MEQRDPPPVRVRMIRSEKATADARPGVTHEPPPATVAGNRKSLPRTDEVWRFDLIFLLGLFVSFRVFAIPFFKPGGEVYAGAHDYHFYLQMAELSLEGFYPYVHYWLEYPPVFPWALLALFNLALLLPSWPNSMMWFQITVTSFLFLFEVGNLVLVYAIVNSFKGRRVALRAGWMYAGLFYPLYVLTNWFDVMPLFFILLGLYATIRGWPVVAGLAAGLGFMTKLIPAVIAPLALLALPGWWRRLVFAAAAGAITLAIIVPLVWQDPMMTIASVRSMVDRSSWLTPWALLEGYYGVGNMPAWPDRFNPQSAEWELHRESLPWFWINVAMVLSFLALYTRRLPWSNPRVLLAAAALSFNILLLFSKGWSPQFLLYVLAFLVVNLPNSRGLVYALILTLNNFVEWPAAGIYFARDPFVLTAVVTVRTMMLIVLCWEYTALIWPRLGLRWETFRSAAAMPAAVGFAVFAASIFWVILGTYVDRTPQRPLAEYIEMRSLPGQSLLASSREAFYTLVYCPRATRRRVLGHSWLPAGRRSIPSSRCSQGTASSWCGKTYGVARRRWQHRSGGSPRAARRRGWCWITATASPDRQGRFWPGSTAGARAQAISGSTTTG